MNPDPLTVPEAPEAEADHVHYGPQGDHVHCVECGFAFMSMGRESRLTVPAGWLLVVALAAAVVGVIVGRLTG